MSNALIVGIDSTIGRALHHVLNASGWTVYGTTRKKNHISPLVFYLDLLNAGAFRFKGSVDVVYWCAGVTQIAACERHLAESRIVNLEAPLDLIHGFLNRGIPIVYLSSNAVFDGAQPKYRTTDRTCPTTRYGEYKVLVEEDLLRQSKEVAIIRLTKVLTKEYALILQWIRALQKGLSIEPFYDLPLSPIAIHVVTNCLKTVAEKKLRGIIHLSGEEDVTYADIAYYLADSMKVNKKMVTAKSIMDSATFVEKPPLFASLDMSDSKKIFDNLVLSFSPMMHSLYGNKVNI